MKTKERFFLLALCALIFVNVQTANAQVTIGGEIAPVKGATLDLSPEKGYVGAFKLPNVSLDDLTSIPSAFTESSVSALELIGSMVYNTNSTIGAGIYLWDGTKWQAMLSSGVASSLDKIYPVGSIYMSVSSTNPGDIFGGTWAAWGEGRVPVGVAPSGTFNSVEKEDGSETHTLTVAEMPSHTHIQNAHAHQLGAPQNNPGNGFPGGWAYNVPAIYASAGINHFYTSAAIATNQNTGGGQAHNNLQPYITCYMWKRTQ